MHKYKTQAGSYINSDSHVLIVYTVLTTLVWNLVRVRVLITLDPKIKKQHDKCYTKLFSIVRCWSVGEIMLGSIHSYQRVNSPSSGNANKLMLIKYSIFCRSGWLLHCLFTSGTSMKTFVTSCVLLYDADPYCGKGKFWTPCL